jgi:uncharacterized protein YxeA
MIQKSPSYYLYKNEIMRNPFVILFLVMAGILVNCQEKKAEVPLAVKESFKVKYPNENDPDFEQDAHDYWEAHFKKDGEKYRADFNADGSWIETENSIKKKNLPEAIKKAIKKEYADEEITEVEHVMSASKGEFYDVEFKRKGKNKDVEYRVNGTKVEGQE